jgi:hypothetical protein
MFFLGILKELSLSLFEMHKYGMSIPQKLKTSSISYIHEIFQIKPYQPKATTAMSDMEELHINVEKALVAPGKKI